MQGFNVMSQMIVVLLFVCLVDLFGQDVKLSQSKTVWGFLQNLVVAALLQIMNLSDKLAIHEHSLSIVYCCLFLLPLCVYITKMIPLRYPVYSPDTLRQLEVYGYMIA